MSISVLCFTALINVRVKILTALWRTEIAEGHAIFRDEAVKRFFDGIVSGDDLGAFKFMLLIRIHIELIGKYYVSAADLLHSEDECDTGTACFCILSYAKLSAFFDQCYDP